MDLLRISSLHTCRTDRDVTGEVEDLHLFVSSSSRSRFCKVCVCKRVRQRATATERSTDQFTNLTRGEREDEGGEKDAFKMIKNKLIIHLVHLFSS